MEAITDLPIPQTFTDVVRGEPTTIEEAVDAYLNDPARLQQWLDSNATRSSAFNYELRHPGHGDQSVHNPHKGGGAYAPGGWRPVSKAELETMDRKVFNDMEKNRPSYNQDTAFAKYRSQRAQGDTYVNGSVVVRFPARNKLTPGQQQTVLKEIDTTSKFVPDGLLSNPDFPIEVSIGKITTSQRYGEWIGDRRNGGRINIAMDIASSSQKVDGNRTYQVNTFASQLSVFPKEVPWQPQANAGMTQLASTIAHEFGHASQDFNRKAGNTASFSGIGFISKYSMKNSSERYAEHFSAWVAGATDSMTTTLASDQGWRKP